jgi:anti-sigma factor ChrR (cupin superfamily)
MAGVGRRMLDRIGDEVARATSIVRYAPGSQFSHHTHTGGEEFLALDGVFQDEHGDFPVGSYIRNPPTSSHTPGSAPGCTIFVKLWQFQLEDRTHININTNKMRYVADADRGNIQALSLFNDGNEDVVLERWDPGVEIALASPDGLEILTLAGSFSESDEAFEVHSWLRLPKGCVSSALAGPIGAHVCQARAFGIAAEAPAA